MTAFVLPPLTGGSSWVGLRLSPLTGVLLGFCFAFSPLTGVLLGFDFVFSPLAGFLFMMMRVSVGGGSAGSVSNCGEFIHQQRAYTNKQ